MLIKELEKIQKSEINYQISCFYDAGFNIKIGDEMNGFKWEDTIPTFREAVKSLIENVCRIYPTSDYALKVEEIKNMVKTCDNCRETDTKSCRYPCNACNDLIHSHWRAPD